MAKKRKSQPDYERPTTVLRGDSRPYKGVMLLWPSIFEKAVIKGKPQDHYSTKLILMPSENANEIKWLKANIRKLAQDVLGMEISDVDHCCLRKLNFDTDSEVIEEGSLELVAKTKKRPVVVAADGKTPLDSTDVDFYSGIRCAVRVSLWAAHNKEWDNDNIGCNLDSLQVLDDTTDALVGGISFDEAISGFEDVAEADTDFGGDDDDDEPF